MRKRFPRPEMVVLAQVRILPRSNTLQQQAWTARIYGEGLGRFKSDWGDIYE